MSNEAVLRKKTDYAAENVNLKNFPAAWRSSTGAQTRARQRVEKIDAKLVPIISANRWHRTIMQVPSIAFSVRLKVRCTTKISVKCAPISAVD